jgi:DNA-directed RNA polymerase subunit RPC12/RpoP
MMIDPVGLVFLYLLVFLAAVLLPWLIFTWKRSRSQAEVRRFFICGTCGHPVPVEPPRIWVRCPSCGARQRFSEMKEKT